ncbi:hypothetical protein PV08_09217 [Exophiala spinifera]|uniref:Uncharacterized protein n=1 Tax=Exophiala spinifera TaxID=91928 RepID=A0A0D2BL53_9EURO|nr:uncharacterized protein PV08_09217 [Exophiala spinifera]KIW11944.1 hypothetical protein PV08_09217 [Exophiala spinifera]
MHLLKFDPGGLSLTKDLIDNVPGYAILSHTWGADDDEVTFNDLKGKSCKSKAGYRKIQFCAEQAQKDGLEYFWVDTCCIDKTNLVELSEAIVSMFRWYANAERCYVFLSDISAGKRDYTGSTRVWESAFRKSRWFTRGWTLQELLAPRRVEFYSREGVYLGDKATLEQVIHEVTGIPGAALRQNSLADFSPEERMRWSFRRETKRVEDKAYCLLGIFNVSMPPVYGEGDRAFDRLKDAIARDIRRQLEGIGQSFVASNSSNLVVRGYESTSTPAEEAALLDRRKTMLASLGFEQMDSRRSTIKTAYSSTCKWLLKHRAYLDWIDPEQIYQHRGCLWINGKPGAGKSTLVKFALACAERARRENEILLSFFFNARGDELEKSTVGMYRALLFQLLTKMTDTELQGLDDVGNLTDQRGSPLWTVETLCRLLSAAVTRLGHRRLKCFIDALDECDEEQVQEMIFYFEELGQTALEHGTQLSICFASRHYPTIDIRGGRQLTLEDEDGHAEDLEKYVQSHLRAGKGKVIEEVRTQIREKANGVFLWAVLVIPILNEEFRRGRIFAVKKKIQEVPTRLGELFKDILTKDCVNMNDLLLCLQWILFAKRPLRREEFYFAMMADLAPDSEYMTTWNPEDITADDMNRFVLNSSKGLAELTRSKTPTVQFIHESVRDFLIKDNGLSELWPDLSGSSSFEGESHQRLKGCCLNYMRIDVTTYIGDICDSLPKAFTEQAALLRQSAAEHFPFLEYAVRNVLHHANKAQATGVDQSDFVHTFQLAKWVWIDNLFERHEVRRHTPNMSFLYLLAENNLASLIRIHPSNPSCFDVEGERYGPPIFAALASGSDEAVRVLLEVHADTQPTTSPFHNLYQQFCRYGNKQINLALNFTFPQRKGPLTFLAEHGDDILLALYASAMTNIESTGTDRRTALSWMAGRGNEAGVKLLLKKRAKIESKDRFGVTPLSHAARNGHETIVKLLLEKGAEIESKSNSGQTALSWAAMNKHETIVKLLLEKGADIESKDGSGTTALSWAAMKGHETIVKLLLEKGADIESKDGSGTTSLSWAAMKGYKTTVKLLLETGTDIESKDRSGRTPLFHAAMNGHETILKLLLEKGAEVDLKDICGRTPLSWAAARGHERIVKLLLDKGAELEPEDPGD